MKKSQILSKHRRNNPCGHIYKTTNKVNGLFYIGQCHYTPREKKNYLGSGLELKKDIKKYSKENFNKKVLEKNICSFKKLEEREIFWTNKYNPNLNPKIGYNRKMGNCSKISTRTLKKMSDVQKKWKRPPYPENAKKKLSLINSGKGNPFYGKKHTKETKEKIGKNKKDIKRKPYTQATLKKLSETKIGKLNPKAKAIKCYINNILYKTFDCVNDLSKKFKIPKSTILYNEKHNRLYKIKYKFEYVK